MSHPINRLSWPFSVAKGCHVFAAHNLAVLSYDDVSTYSPWFFSYTTLETTFVCAGIVYSIFRFLRSHTLQELSMDPVKMWYPLGDQSMLMMPLRWPSRNMMHWPVRRSQTRPKESIPPVAVNDPSVWNATQWTSLLWPSCNKISWDDYKQGSKDAGMKRLQFSMFDSYF